MAKRYRHLKYNDRVVLEERINTMSIDNIAKLLGVSRGTIYRELKKGTVDFNTDGSIRYIYSADCAQKEYEENVSNRGKQQLINDTKLYEILKIYIEKERLSPERAIEKLVVEYPQYNKTISVPTLYRYIRDGLFIIKDNHVVFENNRILFKYLDTKYELVNNRNNLLIAKVITELLEAEGEGVELVYVKTDKDDLIIGDNNLRDFVKFMPLTISNGFPSVMAYDRKRKILVAVCVKGMDDYFDTKRMDEFCKKNNGIHVSFVMAYNSYDEMVKDLKSIPGNTSIWIKSHPSQLVIKKEISNHNR